MKCYTQAAFQVAGHVHLTVYCVFIKADMSVTSPTSHNIGCPQEITIQVEEIQYCFYNYNKNYTQKKKKIISYFTSYPVLASFQHIFHKICGKSQMSHVLTFLHLFLRKIEDDINHILSHNYLTDQHWVLMSCTVTLQRTA